MNINYDMLIFSSIQSRERIVDTDEKIVKLRELGDEFWGLSH